MIRAAGSIDGEGTYLAHPDHGVLSSKGSVAGEEGEVAKVVEDELGVQPRGRGRSGGVGGPSRDAVRYGGQHSHPSGRLYDRQCDGYSPCLGSHMTINTFRFGGHTSIGNRPKQAMVQY